MLQPISMGSMHIYGLGTHLRMFVSGGRMACEVKCGWVAGREMMGKGEQRKSQIQVGILHSQSTFLSGSG